MKLLSSLLIVALLLQPVITGRSYAQEVTARPSVRELHLNAIENAIDELPSTGMSPAMLEKRQQALEEQRSDLERDLASPYPEHPVMAMAQETVTDIRTRGLPAFPEDALRPAVDWTALDWDTEFVTPKAEQEFLEERERLLSEGKIAEVKALRARRVPLHDSEALGFVRPPDNVRAAVEDYSAALRTLDAQGEDRNALLHALATMGKRHDLKNALLSRLRSGAADNTPAETEPTDDTPDEEVIDLGVLEQLRMPRKEDVPAVTAPVAPVIESFQHESEEGHPVNFIPDAADDLLLLPPGEKRSAFRNVLSTFIPVAQASEGSTLMNYYSGIEEEPIDLLLLSLTEQQNEDGSMGRENRYYHTYRIAETLSQMDKAYTDDYGAMMDYLQSTEPVNNRDKALKAIVLQSLGQSPTTIMDDLAGQFTTVAVDGVPRITGIGMLRGHEPDVETMIAFANASLVTGLHTDLLPYTIVWISNRIDPAGYLRYNASALPSLHLVNTVAQSLIRFRGMTYTFGTQTVVIDSKISLLLSYLHNTTPVDLIDILMTLRTFEMYADDAVAIRALRDEALRSQSPDGSFGVSLHESSTALSALRETDVIIQDTHFFAGQNRQPFSLDLTLHNAGQLPLWSVKLHVFAGKTFLGTHTVALSTPLMQFSERGINVTLPASFTDTLIGSVPLTIYAELPTDVDEQDNWVTRTVDFQPSSVQLNGALPPASPLLTQGYVTYTQGQVRFDGRFLYRQDARRTALRIILKHVGTNTTVSGVLPATGLTDGTFYSFAATLPTAALDEYQVQLVAEIANGTQYGEPPFSAWVQTYDIVGSSAFTVRENSVPLAGVTLPSVGGDLTSDESGAAVQDFVRTGRLYTYVLDPQFEPFIHRYNIRKDEQTVVPAIITRRLLDTTPPFITDVRVRNGTYGSSTNLHADGAHIIEVSATDETALKHAEVEYWNPQTAQWISFTKTPFTSPNLAVTSWVAPDGLAGNGFKLRARVTDFGSNVSAWLESDPFNLIAGNVISVDGLTNNSWALGITKTVTFDFSTIPNASYVDGIYLNSDAYRFAFGNTTFTGTQRSLTIPLNGNRLAQNAWLEANVYNTSNVLTTAFSPLFNVVDTSPPPAEPWHTPTLFADMNPGSLLSRSFEYIDEREDGSADVVYTEVSGLSTLASGEVRSIMFRSLRNGVWQEPVVIATHTIFSESDRFLYDAVRVQPDAGAGVHVLYHMTQYTDGTKTKIFSALVRNQSLIRNEELTSGTPNTLQPSLAVTPDGSTVLAAWSDLSSGTAMITLRRRTGSGWSMNELPSQQGKYPAVAADGTRDAIIMITSSGIRYRSYDGTAWSAAQPVTDPAGQEILSMLAPVLFMNADGSLDVFMKSLSANVYHLRHLRYVPSTGSSPVAAIEDHDLVAPDIEEFSVWQAVPSTYHIFYTQYNGSSAINVNGFLSLQNGQIESGANVFPLLQDTRKPLLDSAGTDLIAFGKVLNSGFDDYDVQRNFASILEDVPDPPPPLSAPSAPDLRAQDDWGVSNTDNLTAKNTGLTFSIASCVSGATVRLLSGGTVLGSAACGTVVSLAGTTLANGIYTLTADQVSGAQTSPLSAALSVTIDASIGLPGLPDLLSADDNGTNTTDNVTGKKSLLRFVVLPCEAGATVKLYANSQHRGTGTCTSTGVTITMTGSALADGAYAFMARQTDTAGNTSAASPGLTLTIASLPMTPGTPDLIAAHDTGVSNTDNVTNKTSGLKFDVTTCSAGSLVQLYAGSLLRAKGTCTNTGVTLTMTGGALPSGNYSLTANAANAVGVSGFSASLSLTIDSSIGVLGMPDLVAADDTGVSTTDNITFKNSALRFSVNGCEAGATVKLFMSSQHRGTGTCTATSITLTMTGGTLADGTYAVTIRQTDMAGNTSAASPGLSVTIKSTAATLPAPDLLAADDNGTSNTDNVTTKNNLLRFTVGGCETGAVVKLYANSQHRGTGTCTSTGVTITMTGTYLSDGVYTFMVRQTDSVGNVSVASPGLNVTIMQLSTPATPDLIAAYDTGVSSTDNLTNIAHHLKFDVQPCTKNSLVILYSGAVLRGQGTCTATGVTITMTGADLVPGNYSMTTRSVNAVGYSGFSVHLPITVDTAAGVTGTPDLLSADDNGASTMDNITTKNSALRFTLSGCEIGATVKLYANSQHWGTGACTSTGVTITMTGTYLADGAYAFMVRQTDIAGNISAASPGLTVVVDTTVPPAPSTPDLLAADDDGTSSTDNMTTKKSSLRFVMLPCEASASVKLYAGSMHRGTGICTSTGVTITMTGSALADGIYAFSARQTDAAGNDSALSTALTVTISSLPMTPGMPDLIAMHDTGISNTDNVTNKTSGLKFDVKTCSAGSLVQLFSGSTLRAKGTCTNTGVTLTMTGSALQRGVYAFKARATNASGATPFSAILSVTIDTASAAPGKPDLLAADDNGFSSTDNSTSKKSGLRFIIKPCEVSAIVKLYAGSMHRGTGTCTSTGVTITMTGSALATGSYSFKANQRDTAGNLSAYSSALTVKIVR